MDPFRILVPAGLLALPAWFYLRPYFPKVPSAREWATAWVVLYLAGLCDLLQEGNPAGELIAELGSSLFVGLIMAGSLRFTWRPVPSWLLPTALGLGAFTGAIEIVDPIRGDLLGSLTRSAGLGWAAWWLLKSPARESLSKGGRMIGLLLATLAALQAVDVETPAMAPHLAFLTVSWLVLSLCTAGLQLLTMVERAQQLEQELLADRQAIRGLSDAISRGDDARHALTDLAKALRDSGSLPFLGVWAVDAPGRTLELVEWPADREAPPAEYTRIDLRDPVVDPLKKAPGPIVLYPTDEDTLETRAMRAHELTSVISSPLRSEGELVGILSAVATQRRGGSEAMLPFMRRLVGVVGSALARIRNTERAAAQAAELELGRSLLLATIEAIPAGILLIDAVGNAVLSNQAFADLVGIESGDDLAGRSMTEELPALRERFDRPQLEKLAGAMEGSVSGRGLPVEAFELTTREGTLIRLSERGVGRDGGAELGRVWVAEDVTTDRKMAERMANAERLESLGTLAGGLAHDFNNQLTGILGNARLLLEDLAGTDERRLPLEELSESAEHCAGLTQGLLTFARGGPVSRVPIDLAPLIAEVEELLRPSLPPNLRLRIDVAPGTPQVTADPGELRRVLMTLLVNARDAVGSRGEIDLLVGPGVEPGHVELTIRDDGIGMDDEVRRRIFDPFFTTKAKGSGTGLGLALAHGIIEAHGATIEVESELGRGSTFRLQWPASRESSSASWEHRRGSTADSGGATILVAEDEPGVRRMVRRALERAGYRVIEAEDGDRAGARFRVHRAEVGLALCDLSMPGQDGLTALEQMRAQVPGLPAIVMSGHPDREFGGHWPDDVPLLAKPFGPDQLLARVGAALGESVTPEA